MSIKIKRNIISKEEVLSKITEYDIYRMYYPNKGFKINTSIHSPFRNDRNPSFLVGNKKGKLCFIDFADDNYKGDCFDFVQKLYNISLKDALIKINNDFGLGLMEDKTETYKEIVTKYEQPSIIENIPTNIIQVVTKKFTKDELQYWNKFSQSLDDLKKENVYSVKELFLNRRKLPVSQNEMKFGYLYGDKWKIYTPFAKNKKEKWFPNNVPNTTMDGKQNINNSKIAFINKSKKDYMVIKKLLKETCAVQNEGISCFNEENVNFLKNNSEVQILSFDSDETGVKNSLNITKLFNFSYCNVPRKYLKEGIKDWAELCEKHGMQTIEEILKQKQIL
jgi:DNA primase